MSDNEKKDLTRIENLAEFLHSEDDDDFSDLEAAFNDNDVPPVPGDDDEMSDLATDPDIKIPEGLNSNNEESTDFSALEDNEDDFQTQSSENEEVEFESPTEDDQDFEVPAFEEPTDEQDFETNEFSNDESEFSSESSDFESTDDFNDQQSDFENGNDFQSDEDDQFSSSEDFQGTEDFQDDSEDFSSTDNFQESDNFDNQEDSFSNEDPMFDENEENTGFDNQENEDNSLFEEDEPPQMPNTPTPASFSEPSINDDSELEEPSSIFGDSPKTPLPIAKDEEQYKAPENFRELQHFAKNMSYGNMAKEGNPPFSIILKDIKYEEDVLDIVRLLIEYKIIPEEERDQAVKSLSRGSMLLPRLGEYAAISLCHKLRRYDINLLMGLTEEVSPAKEYESDDRGLTTKFNVYNNKQHHWKFEKQDISIHDVVVSTTPYIDGHDILEYISVVTESTTIDMQEFVADQSLAQEVKSILHKPRSDFYPLGNETDPVKSKVTLNDIYHSLVEKCKGHAINQKANALVGINFVITPIILDDAIHVHSKYQITCSGSAVWIKKR